jgi:hypothetical protein
MCEKAPIFFVFLERLSNPTVQVQSLGLRWWAGRENARREAAAGRRRDEEEGGPLPKLRVRRPQAFLCAGACAREHTPGARTSLVRTAAAGRVRMTSC